ncbi:MAG: hypothetical protein JSS04_21005 [Proteobacteria bacterium]|nr:hypothetical protein [Pseudomonadota bacterium]
MERGPRGEDRAVVIVLVPGGAPACGAFDWARARKAARAAPKAAAAA